MIRSALIVLAIHGGGFAGGSPADVRDFCDEVRSQGTRCVVVDYPLRDLPAAVRYVRNVAARYRFPVAYGESAGGLLSARLAAEGRVMAAVSAGGPLNLVDFDPWWDPGFWEAANITPRQRRRYSVTTCPESPLRLIDNFRDSFVPWEFNRPLQRRCESVTRRLADGDHLQDPRTEARAINFLLRPSVTYLTGARLDTSRANSVPSSNPNR